MEKEEYVEPNQKDLLFAWLITRYKVRMFTSMIDVPILAILWYLNYDVGFWIFLVLGIMTDIGISSWIGKVERKLGIDV